MPTPPATVSAPVIGDVEAVVDCITIFPGTVKVPVELNVNVLPLVTS